MRVKERCEWRWVGGVKVSECGWLADTIQEL